MDLGSIRARRRAAAERALWAWGTAILPDAVESFGVEFPDAWWWHAARYALIAWLAVALAGWLYWLSRERRSRRATTAVADRSIETDPTPADSLLTIVAALAGAFTVRLVLSPEDGPWLALFIGAVVGSSCVLGARHRARPASEDAQRPAREYPNRQRA